MSVGWGWLLNMADVAFISYRRLPSFSLASLIQEKLKNTHQINAYVDVTRADGARVQFPERLMQAIADSPIFVCLLGEGTLDSEWVLKEIREVHRLEKPCIPVFQEKFPVYSGDDPAINYLLAHDGVHVLDVKGIHIDYSVSQIADLIRKTLDISTTAPTLKPAAPIMNFDIHEAIDRYDAAMEAEQWYDARTIIEEIRDSEQILPGFKSTREWNKLTSIITKIETDTARDKAYSLIQRRFPRLSMDELKDALNDFWQTYPDYDPSYLVKPRPHVWIKIPAGKVTLKASAYLKESTIFDVPSFNIGKYPVTVAQYDEFIQDNGYQNDRWWNHLDERVSSPNDLPNFSRPDHPRVQVNWFEAIAYCLWLEAKIKRSVWLITEEQWQRAAQGDDNRLYPWGDNWKTDYCNTSDLGIRATTPVSRYEGKGDSPYKVVDMLGNVSEWCITSYSMGNSMFYQQADWIVRGGSWDDKSKSLDVTFRDWRPAYNQDDLCGFRIAIVSQRFLPPVSEPPPFDIEDIDSDIS